MSACFQYASGYGYNDQRTGCSGGRFMPQHFHTEAALVRPQITCGSACSLALALAANLRPGDELSLSGRESRMIHWKRSSASAHPKDESLAESRNYLSDRWNFRKTDISIIRP